MSKSYLIVAKNDQEIYNDLYLSQFDDTYRWVRSPAFADFFDETTGVHLVRGMGEIEGRYTYLLKDAFPGPMCGTVYLAAITDTGICRATKI